MAENSHISWTTHTWNPWWSCVKVSPACANCYAETLARRFGVGWGKDARRRFFGDKHWAEPLKWQRKAEKGSTPEERHPRVFCASMADVFEQLPDNHPDTEQMTAARDRLWELIEATPNLNWLLLTKRPENIRRMVPPAWWGQRFPENVWLGVTVEDQRRADERLPLLMQAHCRVRFVSCEPLLGPLDLFHIDDEECAWRGPGVIRSGGMTQSTPDFPAEGYDDSEPGIDWVISGGESGTGARITQLDWLRGVRDQCIAAGIPFHHKQNGEWLSSYACGEMGLYDCQLSPSETVDGAHYYRVGREAAGRLLDGRTWDQFPVEVSAPGDCL